MPQPKYITINGVMTKNPDYFPEGAAPSKAPAAASSTITPLAIVSSIDDIMAASEIQMEAMGGMPVPMAPSSSATIQMLQNEETLSQFKSPEALDGGRILDTLGIKFTRYETPLGLLNKLMMLREYKLDFIVDDSGSMVNTSDVEIAAGTDFMQQAIAKKLGHAPEPGKLMNRLQEAEDRLHIMIGFLAYIPVQHIQIRFLNSKVILMLDRTGLTPEQFEANSHDAVHRQFSSLLLEFTPVEEALKSGFDSKGKWSHYFFNDGEPDEGGDRIAKQISTRKNPELHPLTLLSCTNQDGATDWMKKADAASCVAELDDFEDERREILKTHGPAFSYTRGLWILSQLVASIDPDVLDALDETLPFTRFTLSDLYGRELNPREYQYYFQNNPNAALYAKEYTRFLNENCLAKIIIPKEEQQKRERVAGYKNGERPAVPLVNISEMLTPITEAAYKEFARRYAEPASQHVQASAATIAPYAAFMPPAAAGALYPPAQPATSIYPPPASKF